MGVRYKVGNLWLASTTFEKSLGIAIYNWIWINSETISTIANVALGCIRKNVVKSFYWALSPFPEEYEQMRKSSEEGVIALFKYINLNSGEANQNYFKAIETKTTNNDQK